MAERAQKIAEGDLTSKIEINNKDEMGTLAKAFNFMLEGIHRLLEQINNSAQLVGKLSQNLSETTDALSSSIQEVADSTGHVAASAQELSGNSQEMAHKFREISGMAAAGEKEMKETVGKMKEIVNDILLLRESIERLDHRSLEINKIINMINGIAEQTNLLALNAAIEAARAGEQGRGFSVVAEEVRKLAEQSAQATAEIGELIKATRADTVAAVRTMEKSVENVAAGSRVMEASEQSFRRIIDSIQELMTRIEGIAAAAEELSASSQQVAAATEEQSAATEEIAFSSSELKRSAEMLYSHVKQYKLE
jgi:methyl-accepting chemotaxis protein